MAERGEATSKRLRFERFQRSAIFGENKEDKQFVNLAAAVNSLYGTL
jgi:hypothetical protein